MKPIFTAEDFQECGGFESPIHRAAVIANNKIGSMLGPEVWIKRDNEGRLCGIWPVGGGDPTHSALLFNAQELPKKECVEHVPKLKSKQTVGFAISESEDPFGVALVMGCSIVCAECGVELRAEWREDK